MEAEALRAEFPVLRRRAYLNAGTDGPLPARAVQASQAELERELTDGRTQVHFQRRGELRTSLREGYARAMGCAPEDVALTTSTSEGVAIVVHGLRLAPGQEILTSDEEHPGLLGALQAARELDGAEVRMAPLAELAEAVGPRTALVACSHVSWVTGSFAPEALAGLDVPVLLDGAQGIGAVPLDVSALGCAAYAGSGQKWLCGPDGTGALYVSPGLRERLASSRRGYENFSHPALGLEGVLHEDARRFDTMSLSAEALALARGSLDVFEEVGWPAVHERARTLAAELARRLAEARREVAPRDATTLVSFSSPDAEAERTRLADVGVIVRNLPERDLLRASVGAWNDESDLDRLLGALGPAGVDQG